MHLKSLELSGFKSFAKKTELTFTTPVTAIVGPNGSGKSNIAEAFRFALGEQSVKTLRGKRTEDLIWNGTTDVPRSSRASVSLLFDNSRRVFPVDFDEVKIERVVYRDASTEYKINGSLVRLRDIVELISKANIGASGHHIISQGEADRILSANSSDRREMIEEALGLKIYQWKREESVRKLEKAEENRRQVEALRHEILPHLKFLKKQVEKVEKMKGLRDELRTFYAEYLARESAYINEEGRRIKEELSIPESQLKIIEKSITDARSQLSTKTGDGERELIELEGALRQVREKREIALREIGRIEGQVGGVSRVLENLKRLHESGEPIPFDRVRLCVSKIDEEMAVLPSTASADDLRNILLRMKEAFHSLLESGQSKKSEIEIAEKEASDLQNKKQALEAETESFKNDGVSIDQKIRSLQTAREAEKDKLRSAERDLYELIAKEREARVLIDTLRSREKLVNTLYEEMKREIAEGLVLVGSAIRDYERHTILDSAGNKISTDIVCNEPREAQGERRRHIEKLKIRLEESGVGSVDEVLKEFKDVSDRDQFLAKELADLEVSSATLTTLIKELEERIAVEFESGLKKINLEFEKFFSLLFGGGSAELRSVKEPRRKRVETELSGEGEGDTEYDIGLEVSVKIPRKNIKSLMMLSGGERSLTSIALIFAVSQVNPPPFIILDETDAALDEANSRKYGDMLEELAKHSELIVITHNRETMSRAGVLYGVTMDRSGISKLLSIKFDQAVEVAK